MSVERAFREEWGAVVAVLVGMFRDVDLAEEAAQEAFTRAIATWPRDGEPAHPRAWLVATARNRAIDRLRREGTLAAKTALLAVDERETDVSATPMRDERLELIFMCCHPALAVEAQVALTLRSVAGMSAADIAQAFLVPEATMAKRLVRARQKIKLAGIPFRLPAADQLAERLDAVLAVVYLVFNEGYAGSAELTAEALWVGRALAELLPDEPEVLGLLALMLLHDSRREARSVNGEMVLLDDQDRRLWDHEQIQQGRELLGRATALGGRGPYVVQAAIALAHTGVPPDRTYIAVLYGELARITGSTVVELNRAVAIAEIEGPEAGLAIIDRLDLVDYRYLHAARAELLHRAGRHREAVTEYDTAIRLVRRDAERRQFARRRDEIAGAEG